MDPIIYNSIIAVVELVYTLFIVRLTDILVKRKKLSQDMSRKIVHLWAAGLLFFWFFYVEPYAQYFFITTPLIWVFLMLYTGIFKGPDDPNVRSMTRNNNPHELLFGPLFFVIMMIVFTFISFKTIAGVVALSAMGFGDGIAPIIGKNSKMKFMHGRKSVEGSASVFLATLVGIFVIVLLFGSSMGFKPTIFNIEMLIIAALIGTIVEAITPSNYDNITVPIAVWLFLIFVLPL
ncbi:MAG: diacylglycerol/polyprenol kinase family protein [Candidatus Micrarchaeales archaeon]